MTNAWRSREPWLIYMEYHLTRLYRFCPSEYIKYYIGSSIGNTMTSTNDTRGRAIRRRPTKRGDVWEYTIYNKNNTTRHTSVYLKIVLIRYENVCCVVYTFIGKMCVCVCVCIYINYVQRKSWFIIQCKRDTFQNDLTTK